MVETAAILINSIGLVIGLFSVIVATQIFTTYRLRTTLWFVGNAIGISVWNLLHVIFLLLPLDTDPRIIQILWLILVHSGLVFLMCLVIGFHRLRYDETRTQMFLYIFIMGFYSAMFINKPDWITYTYTQQDGFSTMVINSFFWLTFSLMVGIIVFLEVLAPFIEAYTQGEHDRKLILAMIVAGFLASFSNVLLPAIDLLGWPHAVRFLIADIGFLIFFLILWKYPFMGMYDQTELRQMTVSTSTGEPLMVLSDFDPADVPNSVLTSGVFSSINSVLEEITLQYADYSKEVIREFQLGENNFYIVANHGLTTIFWYTEPTGVCRSKFRSLGRIAEVDSNRISKETVEHLHELSQLYFPGFEANLQYYHVL
ncbi:MAG: hypothetical protein ACXAE3_02820 [Candidatus Kariarchaeaceae archaeon]